MTPRSPRSHVGGSLKRSLDLPSAVPMTQQAVPIELLIQVEESKLAEAIALVDEIGGEVRTNGKALIQASVPVDQIGALASAPPITLVEQYVAPTTLDSTPTGGHTPASGDGLPRSEGVERSGAAALHDRDMTGAGVTIAILDTNFDIENERYADQVVATLGDDDDPSYGSAYESPGGHGDGVADIVAAMAPEAELVLGDTFQMVSFFQALDEIESDYPAVELVNYSVGHAPNTRLDGQDAYSGRISDFTENGRLFVASSGNSAAVENVWQYDPDEPIPIPRQRGDCYDSRGDAEFTTEDDRELLVFDANFDESLAIPTRLPVGTTTEVVKEVMSNHSSRLGSVFAHWDEDPEIDDQDYRVSLYRSPGATESLVDSRSRSPWESIAVHADDFLDEASIQLDIEDDEWILTDADAPEDIVVVDESGVNLSLPVGLRLTIDNLAWEDHPLEFRDHNDSILLSQESGTVGSYQDDAYVDWDQNGGEIEFTVTDGDQGGLADAMQSYGSATAAVSGIADIDRALPVYLEIENVDADGEQHFDVWAIWKDIHIPTPWATDERSLGIPAVSQDDRLVTVGAVQAVDLEDTGAAVNKQADDLKSYSSQGPTQDGRRGLDMLGDAHVSTAAWGSVSNVYGFNGTSAGAPHVTGGLALLLSIDDVEVDQARNALYASGRPIADETVDNPGEENTQLGFGALDLEGAVDILDSAVRNLDPQWVASREHSFQYSSPTIEADTVITAGLGNSVSGVNIDDGELVWERPRNGELVDSSPVVSNGTCYIGSGGGTISAIDATAGDLIWEVETASAVSTTPVVLDEMVYAGTNDGTIHARDTADGSEYWTTSVSAGIIGDLAATEGGVYVPTRDGQLLALDPGTGDELWRFDTGTNLSCSPTVVDDRVYVAGTELRSLDAATGDEQWGVEHSAPTGVAPVIDQPANRLYIGNGDGVVSARALDTGSERWHVDVGAAVHSRVGLVGEEETLAIVVGTLDGQLVAIDTQSRAGEIVAEAEIATSTRSSPEVTAKTIVIGTDDGDLHAFEATGTDE